MTLRSDKPCLIAGSDHDALGLQHFTVTSSGRDNAPRRTFAYELWRYNQGDQTGEYDALGNPVHRRFWANAQDEVGVRVRPPVEHDAVGWIVSHINTIPLQQEYVQKMQEIKALFASCSNAGLKVALAYEGIRQGIAAHVSEVMPDTVGNVVVE